MGSLPNELISLEMRAKTFMPKTMDDFIKEVSMIGDVSFKVSKFEGLLKGLEEEMKKIDAFKRELPLCMLLLSDAIVLLREELVQCAASNNNKPVFEEFIPLKKNSDDEDDDDLNNHNEDNPNKKDKDSKDKKTWMSSVQLWNTDDHSTLSSALSPKQALKPESKSNQKGNQYVSENNFQDCKSRTAARAFMPLKSYAVFPKEAVRREELPVPGLSIFSPGLKNTRIDSGPRTRVVSSSAPNSQSSLRNGPQFPLQKIAGKQRRCWSPELHRCFVNALQQLGGSQAATPKQIREVMHVDGLTNDEVKSHLQKYRLHTQRMPSATATPANQSEVVLGGLWMSQDQYNSESSKVTSSQSGSPQGPLQLTGNTGGNSGGDSMEENEDAKSEVYIWKTNFHRSGKDDV